MAIFSEEIRRQISELFAHITEPVHIETFDESEDTDMVNFITELSSISDQIVFEYYAPDSARARELEIVRIPGLNLTRDRKSVV